MADECPCCHGALGDDLIINPKLGTVVYRGAFKRLEPRLARVLADMAAAADYLPFEGFHVNEQTGKVAVCYLRKSLPPGLLIEAVRGKGYRLVRR